MNLIVAVDKNWGIGAKNDLLFNLKQDMAFFRETTLNKIVVMGRNTLESFPGGKPLKNRINICLNDQPNFEKDGVIVVGSLKELFAKINDYETDDVFVIGGASIYRQLLPYCKNAYITKIEAEKPADVCFPNLDDNPDWKLSKEGNLHDENGISFKFCLYTNKNVKNFD